jgi:exodeoxyribonuclease-3
MALHRKFAALMELEPDIAVISECAKLERLRDKAPLFVPASAVWVGENPNKGLGVFAFNAHKVALSNTYDRSIRHIAPVHVSGRLPVNLLAVWAFNTPIDGWSKNRKAPFLRAVDRYEPFLRNASTIVAGDFNNHVLWDKPGYTNNHANAVAALDAFGLVSAYHVDRGVRHGHEGEPTHYWRDRRKDGATYHLDYIFLPDEWTTGLREMTVGSFEDWCGNGLSDHVPLVVDIGEL